MIDISRRKIKKTEWCESQGFPCILLQIYNMNSQSQTTDFTTDLQQWIHRVKICCDSVVEKKIFFFRITTDLQQNSNLWLHSQNQMLLWILQYILLFARYASYEQCFARHFAILSIYPRVTNDIFYFIVNYFNLIVN